MDNKDIKYTSDDAVNALFQLNEIYMFLSEDTQIEIDNYLENLVKHHKRLFKKSKIEHEIEMDNDWLGTLIYHIKLSK